LILTASIAVLPRENNYKGLEVLNT